LNITKDLIEDDFPASCFALKHELSHIKNNDTFNSYLLASITGVGLFILNPFQLGFLPLIFQVNVISLVVYSKFNQWRESRADDFAIRNSTHEELLGGRRFFVSQQIQGLGEQKINRSLGNFIKYTSSGDDRLDFLHPSLSSGVYKIEMELSGRSIHFNSDEELKKTKDFYYLP